MSLAVDGQKHRITREEENCWNREHSTPKREKDIWIETEHQDGIFM
jgi:hypothetical protein